MRTELPVLSFLSALSLLSSMPFGIKFQNISFFFLISWLFLCNVIQAANSLIWAGNVLDHAPAWCVIVTPITLAVRVALPAATTCLCYQLETISSLTVSHNPRPKYLTHTFQWIMCLFVPVAYMLFHIIVQSQPFVITENFGCEASIYTSIPAILIIWPLPLLLCSVTLGYAGVSFHHYHRRGASFPQYPQAGSNLTPALFLRLLCVSALIAVYLIVVLIFDMILRLESGLNRYPAWDQVHPITGDQTIGIVTVQNGNTAYSRTEVVWWLIPLSSILLFIGIGTLKEVFKANMAPLMYVWDRVGIWTSSNDTDILPIQEAPSDSASVISGTTEPFRSGWYDVNQFSPSLTFARRRSKPNVAPIRIPETVTIQSQEVLSSDASFMTSTITYLRSPTGKDALGQASSARQTPSGVYVKTSPSLMSSKSWSSKDSKEDELFGSSFLPWPRPPSNIPSLSSLLRSSPTKLSSARNSSYPFSSHNSTRLPASHFEMFSREHSWGRPVPLIVPLISERSGTLREGEEQGDIAGSGSYSKDDIHLTVFKEPV